MSEAPWWRHLSGDPSRSLFDDDEPGLTWVTLVELLDRHGDSPAVVRAKNAARAVGSAAAILARQNPRGYWGSPFAYASRWHGSAWEVMALAALGADPTDPRVARAGEVLLHVMQPQRGGFSAGHHRPPAACFTAEACAALVRIGFGHDARVREAVGWLAERRRGADGWLCPELRHLVDGGCPVAAVAVLRMIANLAETERRQLADLATGAAAWLRDHAFLLGGSAPHGWLEFQHPCLGRADLLEALYELARCGLPFDAQVEDALRAVLARQGEGGVWRQQHATGHGETAAVGGRWLTLKALVALAAYGEALQVAGE